MSKYLSNTEVAKYMQEDSRSLKRRDKRIQQKHARKAFVRETRKIKARRRQQERAA